jgi:predicted DNA-binding transcriptional regulator AlpA
MADEYLNVKETAARTRIAKSTLDKLRLTGGGPAFIKVGSKVLYRWSDVEAWLASRIRRSTSGFGEAA